MVYKLLLPGEWELLKAGRFAGSPFPHLYGHLDPSHVARSWVRPLTQGRHEFPEGF